MLTMTDDDEKPNGCETRQKTAADHCAYKTMTCHGTEK